LTSKGRFVGAYYPYLLYQIRYCLSSKKTVGCNVFFGGLDRFLGGFHRPLGGLDRSLGGFNRSLSGFNRFLSGPNSFFRRILPLWPS
jgi:hypothetical protein